MDTLTLGRSSNEVAVGDLVEMLLSISFACKDAMLERGWLGIDLAEWPPQRLNCRIEHSACVSNMEASLESWLQYPWHMGYSALRCMACLNWQSTHACPVCKRPDRNLAGGKDRWSYVSGCLEHMHSGAGCMGSLFDADSPNMSGVTMIPTTAELLKGMYPGRCTRDFMPVATIGHRQRPMSISAVLDRFSLPIGRSRKYAIATL